MIQSQEAFRSACKYERTLLTTVNSILNPNAPQGGYDMGSDLTTIGVPPVKICEDCEKIDPRFRPLFFGAAWKILDFLVEYGLGKTCSTGRSTWTIAEKREKAESAVRGLFPEDSEVWQRVAAVYVKTVEHRHSLVHRSFILTPDGDMGQMKDRKGMPISDLTTVEIDAFCQLARQIPLVVEKGHLSNRNRLIIIDSLDSLKNHHGISEIGGGRPESQALCYPVDAIHVEGTRWSVDTQAVFNARNRQHRADEFVNIKIRFPESNFLPRIGFLEDAEIGSQVVIDLLNLPDWIEA